MRLKTTAIAVFALFAGLMLAAPAFAQGTGRSLDIQVGGRENGMGAAGVALTDDAAGMTWWNPAGLGFCQRAEVQLTYAQLVPGLASDVYHDFVTAVMPVEGWGAIGIGLVFLNYGESQEVDDYGTPGPTFGSNEVSPALYYGTRLLPDLSVGCALKYIRIQLAPNTATYKGVGQTFGIDLGALYRIPAAHLRLGANLQNMGPSVTFMSEDESSPLSRNLKTGLAWDVISVAGLSSTVAADFNQSLVTPKFRTYNGGVELKYAVSGGKDMSEMSIAGRAGYCHDALGDIKAMTYGIGISWARLTLDYGSIPQASTLPHVDKISLGYRF